MSRIVMLFVAVSFAAFGASGLAQADDVPALKVKSLVFTPTPAPSNVFEMVTPYTRSEAVVTLADETVKRFPMSWEVLHRSGDYLGGWYAGLIVDRTGQPITRTVPDDEGNAAQGPFFSPGADGVSLLALPNAAVEGVKGHALFLVNHLEYETAVANTNPGKPPVDAYGKLPMAMNLTVLDQDAQTGRLLPYKLSNVDFSAVDGLWNPCNASMTPWLTHLGGEEYEPDAAYFENKPFDGMNLYLGTVGKLAKDGGAKPYQYGHIVEVAVRPDGGTTVTKHFAMGRLSFELADVMADGKTAYIGDDGDDVIRAMFVADQPGDLSAGTLYAAKWNQRSGEGFGSAGLEWIRLGHATDAEIKSLADKGIRFSDIFDIATAEEVKANPEKFANFKPVYAYSGTGGKTTLTYYNLRPGMETAAAFLETRRFAAYKGATTEFTKMEGQAHNSADKKLYTVISYIRKGMIDGQNKDRPRDDISLKGDEVDLTCGAVYQSNLRGNQKDTDGETISSELVATDMTAVIHGERQVENPTAGKYDKCNTEMIANPDNIRYSEAMRTLFIGEDSANHLNNFVWAYGVDDGSLTRLFSAPAGAENTGLTVVDNAYGHAYITTNLQHPGTAEDLSQYPEEIKGALRHLVDERGAVGYFSGLPGLSR